MEKFNLEKLLRANIKALLPYSSARDEFSGAGEYLFFDANENALGSVGSQSVAYNRYPDPYQQKVKMELSKQKNTNEENIFLGNGSDEAIDLLFRAFCEPFQNTAIITPPTYGMYEVCANINNIRCVEVPLTVDFQLNTPEIIAKAATNKASLIFLCSPNNPSGNLLNEENILSILKNTTAIVVVDEAYIDFANRASMIRYLKDFPNLVVLQTFSKAWGLANLRLGKAFASKEIIQILNNIKPPYNINGYTQQMAVKALKAVEKKNEMVAKIIEERERFKAILSTFAIVDKIYPSDANFLLIKMKGDATSIYKTLLKAEIVVRNRSKVLLCENCLRITIGTPSENEQLLIALRNIENQQSN